MVDSPIMCCTVEAVNAMIYMHLYSQGYESFAMKRYSIYLSELPQSLIDLLSHPVCSANLRKRLSFTTCIQSPIVLTTLHSCLLSTFNFCIGFIHYTQAKANIIPHRLPFSQRSIVYLTLSIPPMSFSPTQTSFNLPAPPSPNQAQPKLNGGMVEKREIERKVCQRSEFVSSSLRSFFSLRVFQFIPKVWIVLHDLWL